MTKEDALIAMQNGKKVTHRYFTDNEYMYMENDMIFSEDGVHHKWSEFWDLRSSEDWETDWEIKN